jgi:hypothetical protein
MAVTPKEEPLEPGKKRVKAAKKKTPGKKTDPAPYVPKPPILKDGEKPPAKPKVAQKVDLLKNVEYELIEVEGSARATDKQTHLLTIKKGDKVWKYALYEKPDEREILRHWESV